MTRHQLQSEPLFTMGTSSQSRGRQVCIGDWYLGTWRGASAFHEHRTIRHINIEEVHFPVGCNHITVAGDYHMAVIHVLRIWPLLLQHS